MCVKNDERQIYPFFWLDELLEVTLNPAKTDLKTLTDNNLAEIAERLPQEIGQVAFHLKNQAFALYNHEHIKVVAGQYDQAIRLLQYQAAENLSRVTKNKQVRLIIQAIIDALQDLADAVQRRYERLINMPVPEPIIKHDIDDRSTEKLLFALSADQIGILLKSAFDVKLVLAKSFRKICQILAPFLATTWRAKLSWDSIRSIAGRAEPRDKEIVIHFLQKMISQIRG
ncbi:hypothetical protein [Mucilaginibacter defluvii]|uniref:Uncharacterized protein n=1 Tax=Mucilaginibacter defluvii TaxID=1196019 RepID=A0ABP9FN35_9SPHI|nr:hypothetical protein [Bacteroidota bacterium]